MVNPMLVKGQIHGGVVQGLGQGLFELIAYDATTGQLLTGSFMDYAIPRAADVPFFDVDSHEVPTEATHSEPRASAKPARLVPCRRC